MRTRPSEPTASTERRARQCLRRCVSKLIRFISIFSKRLRTNGAGIFSTTCRGRNSTLAKRPTEVGDRVEIFCTEELYVPDYSSKGLDLTRSMFGMAWFQTCWAFEESRHGLVFREYLTRSGLRSPAQFEALETATFSKEWKLPFQTIRQMACYGALQESRDLYRVQPAEK